MKHLYFIFATVFLFQGCQPSTHVNAEIEKKEIQLFSKSQSTIDSLITDTLNLKFAFFNYKKNVSENKKLQSKKLWEQFKTKILAFHQENYDKETSDFSLMDLYMIYEPIYSTSTESKNDIICFADFQAHFNVRENAYWWKLETPREVIDERYFVINNELIETMEMRLCEKFKNFYYTECDNIEKCTYPADTNTIEFINFFKPIYKVDYAPTRDSIPTSDIEGVIIYDHTCSGEILLVEEKLNEDLFIVGCYEKYRLIHFSNNAEIKPHEKSVDKYIISKKLGIIGFVYNDGFHSYYYLYKEGGQY